MNGIEPPRLNVGLGIFSTKKGLKMKAIDLRKELDRMITYRGEDFDVVLQDSPIGAHPECCKHEFFFTVEEPKDGAESSGMELVLRTWPY